MAWSLATSRFVEKELLAGRPEGGQFEYLRDIGHWLRIVCLRRWTSSSCEVGGRRWKWGEGDGNGLKEVYFKVLSVILAFFKGISYARMNCNAWPVKSTIDEDKFKNPSIQSLHSLHLGSSTNSHVNDRCSAIKVDHRYCSVRFDILVNFRVSFKSRSNPWEVALVSVTKTTRSSICPICQCPGT